ncbi:MAG: outer membrane lipoprotein chaperone LolA [Psychromonas sp.]|nr:outer membrane lipoprotein chaperone LolA [Psychromonas sp.]
MKKKSSRFFCVLLISFLSLNNAVAQSAAMQLKEKLTKFDAMKSDFTQKIISSNGTLLKQGKGTLIISRPGKVIWEASAPDKEKIISNGKTVWFYTPFVEQVSIMNYSLAIKGSPFMLLAGANAKIWSQYIVLKENNKFTIKDKTRSSNKNIYIVTFDKTDNIKEFSRIEPSGQRSSYVFNVDTSYKKPSDKLFEFKIPKGVEVDDQR